MKREEWDALKPEERAVLVAKEALMLSEQFIPYSHNTFAKLVGYKGDAIADLHEHGPEAFVDWAAPHCQVCAIGGLFVSKLRMGFVDEIGRWGCCLLVDRKNGDDALSDCFDDDTLDSIESCFEGGWIEDSDDTRRELTDEEHQFYRWYVDDRHRFQAICLNIIEGGGFFDPIRKPDVGRVTA